MVSARRASAFTRRDALGRPAIAARPPQHDLVRDDGVAALLLDGLDRVLEAGVGERLDLAALATDEVMVVVGMPGGLVANDTVADVDTLDECQFRERVEHPVDAGQADAMTFSAQGVVDLLRAAAAGLRGQVLDHE